MLSPDSVILARNLRVHRGEREQRWQQAKPERRGQVPAKHRLGYL